jgi:hypothetical protein
MQKKKKKKPTKIIAHIQGEKAVNRTHLKETDPFSKS